MMFFWSDINCNCYTHNSIRPAKFMFFESLNTRKWHILQCTPKVEKQYSTSMILKIFLHCSVQRNFKNYFLSKYWIGKRVLLSKIATFLPISEYFLHRQIVLHGAQLDENRKDQIKMLSNDPWDIEATHKKYTILFPEAI